MKELPGSSVDDIADFVIERYYLVEKGGVLYRYDGYRWNAQEDRAHLYKLLRSLNDLGLFYTKVDKKTEESVYVPIQVSATNYDKIVRSIRAAAFETLTPQYAIACDNVVVAVNDSMDGITVRPLDRDYHITAHLPFAYDVLATAPRFLAILNRLFESDAPDEQNRKKALIQEFYGACVFGLASRFQRCLIMHGPGGNGKSTLQEIMKRFVFTGDNCCAVSPMRWHEEFSVVGLRDKRLNSVEELPSSGKLLASDIFKQVVGGSEIQARKLYQDSTKFNATCGHVFSTNTFPRISDQSQGFWRRILLVSCNTSVESGISIDELLDGLEKEAPGILNWCIEGAERLLRNRAYTLPESHHKDLDEWRIGTEPVREFIRDATRVDETKKTRARDLWEAYNRWARQTQHFALGEVRFAEKMKEIGQKRESTNKFNFYRFELLPDENWSYNQTEQTPDQLEQEASNDASKTA
jgi:P4 family phage/plasmid primase-like protien